MIKNVKLWSAIFLAIIIVGMALRIPRLAQRPMHTDEAVHAIKFGSLLEEGVYQYDPYEYHGPTLNYFTLVPAWLTGQETLTQTTEITLRIIPVIFGLLLVPVLLLLKHELSWPAISAIGFFTAISPMMVYYSRYYIMEIMLVFFSFIFLIAIWKYKNSPHVIWIAGIGLSLGLMHATKETFIINVAAALFAIFLVTGFENKNWKKPFLAFKKVPTVHWVILILCAGVASLMFFSSFFSNPEGVLDSVRTYGTYLERAGGNEMHIHPWYYYFHIILFWHYAQGPVWTEAVLLVLAIIGIIAIIHRNSTFSGNGLLKFIAFYTIILVIIFSIIPYKTPWNMLGFFHGIIIMAGIGIVWLFQLAKGNNAWFVAIGIIMVALLHLTWQSYITNFRYPADARNPYVYGHTGKDIYQMVDRIDKIAAVHPRGKEMYVEVIAHGGDYWPFPWYLREYENIGYWNRVNMNIQPAPVIVAHANLEEQILRKIYTVPPPGERNLYVPLFSDYLELRPHVEMRGYVKHNLWEMHEQKEQPLLDSLDVQ